MIRVAWLSSNSGKKSIRTFAFRGDTPTMNKRQMLWVLMMLCGAALLLLSRSQPVLAVSRTGDHAGEGKRADASSVATALGAQRIDAGHQHTCALTTLGSAQCWGFNQDGELGNNSTTNSFIPVNVSGLASGVTAVTAGYKHSCGVVGGAAKCWGDNSIGQLGDGSTTASHVPVSVSGLASGAIAISAATWHTCALTNVGQVECWGANTSGQLGDGSTTSSSIPVLVTGLSGVTAIAMGSAHTCALTSGGLVKCWGANAFGQLGDGSTTTSHVPVPVSGLSGVTAISAGNLHTCALTNAGQVVCWGYNLYGQLGNSTTTDSHTPVLVSGLTEVTAIGVGEYHSCAVTSGVAKCWGYNPFGQLGNNSRTTSSVPVDVSGLVGVVEIAAGYAHSCAVTSIGGVKCWGDNQFGQLGNGESNLVSAPVDVSGLGGDIIALGTRDNHSCALTSGGGVKCWGDNQFGQLGNNSTTYSLAPVDVTGLGSGVLAIAIGANHTCAVTSGGGVKCWGSNSNGQLGNNSTADSSVPVNVSGLTSGVTAVAAGYVHTCALLSGGGVMCWGSNAFGKLGDGSTTESHIPVSVTGLSGAIAIAAGTSHTCAVASGGAKCWGYNAYGQLGNTSTTGSAVPVDVSGLSSGVTAIAAGESHTCAVASGGAQCWGDSTFGQLGNGSTTYSLIPVGVSGLGSAIAKIAAGAYHSCALTGGGAAKCWGANGGGQLGNGSTTGSAVPVYVSGLASGVSVIAAGGFTTCAVVGPASGGTAQCWGYNYFGQVGNGHMGYDPTWVDVLGLLGEPVLYLPIVLR